jgi:hypothetical protein
VKDDVRVDGAATVYRLYDVGYAIDLDRAADVLGGATRGRVRPKRLEARAIQIRNPPLFASLGSFDVAIGNEPRRATLSAHLFDFGVCSLQLRIPLAPGIPLSALEDFAAALDAASAPPALMDGELRTFLERIAPAVERPGVAPLSEEYKVFRVDRITDDGGETELTPAAKCFSEEQLVAILVGERRRLSAAALRELVPHRFSYYEDDLTVLTWESALIVQPRVEDHDVEYVLEFANAQLLELRMFDLQLDAELPKLYDRVEAARARRRPALASRFRAVLSDLQTRVADVTETVERVENALKVTNDVYLARVYAAALELFREEAWRRGIERKLGILRETYAMLNTESQAARMELLEAAVVLPIVAELVLGFLHGRP